MSWKIEITDEARSEIDTLSKEMQARFLRIAELLEKFGPQQVREPHVKHLRDKLWEMRMTGKDGIGRAIYFAAHGRQLVVLHAFIKKTQKTPARAIGLAQKRMEAWNDEHLTERLSRQTTRRSRGKGGL